MDNQQSGQKRPLFHSRNSGSSKLCLTGGSLIGQSAAGPIVLGRWHTRASPRRWGGGADRYRSTNGRGFCLVLCGNTAPVCRVCQTHFFPWGRLDRSWLWSFRITVSIK
ncbi:hypothetical protein AWENTII_000112 [Aspergillus wentii]